MLALLKVETFEQGQKVITEGEEGNKFYIIEAPIEPQGPNSSPLLPSLLEFWNRQDGLCVATKGEVEVMSYAAGDYFGELVACSDQFPFPPVRKKP